MQSNTKLLELIEKIYDKRDIEESNFAPNHSGFPVSRDWEHLACKSKSCLWNVEGECTTPSKAIIGNGGKCEGFKAKVSETHKDGKRVLDI